VNSILEEVHKAEDNKSALRGSAESRRRFPSPIELEDYDESEITQLVLGFAKKNGGFDGGMEPNVPAVWARRLTKQRANESEFSLIDSTNTEG
jgi:hypothetical protein